MKILICIANYGTGNLSFLHTVLKEYNFMGRCHDITVCIDSTDDIGPTESYSNVEIIKRRHPYSVKEGLVFVHREYMAQHADLYDLFIYTENDILITEENINEFLRLSDLLTPEKYLPGFIRYEKLAGSAEKYLLDLGKHGFHLPIVKGIVRIGGELFLELTNTHQGCYLLTRDQLARMMCHPQREVFLRAPGETALSASFWHYSSGYGILESGASDVFNNCGFTKVIGVRRLEQLLVHHLPNKYSANFLVSGELDYLVTLQQLQEDFRRLSKANLHLKVLCLKGMAHCFVRWVRDRFLQCTSEEGAR